MRTPWWCPRLTVCGSAQVSAQQALHQAREDAKGPEVDPFEDHKSSRLVEKEGSYQARRKRIVSPERDDPFADLDDDKSSRKKPAGRSYAQVMQETDLERREAIVQRKIEKQQQEEQERLIAEARQAEEDAVASRAAGKKRRRWDIGNDEEEPATAAKIVKTNGEVGPAPWGTYPFAASWRVV